MKNSRVEDNDNNLGGGLPAHQSRFGQNPASPVAWKGRPVLDCLTELMGEIKSHGEPGVTTPWSIWTKEYVCKKI